MEPTLTIPGLPDRFQVRRYLHRATYAEVVDAIDRDRGQVAVALKVLRPEGANAGLVRTMFRREVEALKGLDHPAIVKILDTVESDHLLVIELELVPGGATLSTLFEDVRVGRAARPSIDWRVRMTTHLADAVLEAHRRGVIHRDIKPANVLWSRDDETLKLADFGISAVLSLMVREPATATVRSFYTRPFASPEQRLQNAPVPESDVYGFGLLVASLLALGEPPESFEPADLDGLVSGALDELRQAGVPAPDVEDLAATLRAALLDAPDARPSMTAIRSVLERVRGVLAPRATASFVLTHTAQKRLADLGFVGEGQILADLEADLRVRIERNDRGERIKLFGRSLWVLLAADSDQDARAIDAGQEPGPKHESNRRSAPSCPLRLRLGRGSCAELVAFAREGDRAASRKATAEIIERARIVVSIERERLPVFFVEAEVLGGTPVRRRRDQLIGQASGYEGSATEKVEVSGAFRLVVGKVEVMTTSQMQNLVKSRLADRGVEIEEDDGEDEVAASPAADWYAMFDDPRDIDVIDAHGHLTGKVVRFDRAANTLHVRTDKKRPVLRVGSFFLRNQQKERLLRQQDKALDALERGATARADMAVVLSESSVHTMGEKPWVTLLQPGLTPAARVQDLVDRILASRTVFCLRGPPGTGKTTVIAEVVAQQLEREPRSRILVCAQANDAVANAIERILKVRDGLQRDWLVVRDVREDRAREEGPWAGYNAAYVAFADRVGRDSVEAAREAGPPVSAAIAEWVNCVEHRARRVRGDFHGLVQVWGTTTARSARPLEQLDGEPYDLVIIDEAAKATVGEVLVPVVRAKKLLLVGDEKQLPPYLEDTTKEALAELGYTEAQAKYSLFEHLYALVPNDHRDMLDVQYRMHTTIGDVVSRLFYEGKVRNGQGTDRRPLPPGDFDRAHRVMWVDIVGRDEKVGKTSRANVAEREVIVRLLAKLDADARRAGVRLEVAVIAAYRGQADKLDTELQAWLPRWKALHVKAATVDAFQGREADVVLYSLVRVGDAERKFLADGRRFNVALSRAKSLLILVGDKEGAQGTPRLKELLSMIPDENQVAADVFVPRPASTHPSRRS